MSSKEFDYIVVGAGTAGCLLANRLSADKNNKVLLVEAGGRDNYHWIHIPIGYLYCIGNPRTDWLFNTEPDPGLNNRSIKYPRGKVLGGCSSINGMIYMRGQARDYDTWAELTGDDCWSWDNCLPDFIAHEDHYRFDASAAVEVSEHFRRLHGAGGEWRVDRQRTRWEILDAFVAAAQQAGIPATDDFNSGDNHGVAYFRAQSKRRLALEYQQSLFTTSIVAAKFDPHPRRGSEQTADRPTCRWQPQLQRRRIAPRRQQAPI